MSSTSRNGNIDPSDVVNLDELFPEEDFPYESGFAFKNFPFSFNSEGGGGEGGGPQSRTIDDGGDDSPTKSFYFR